MWSKEQYDAKQAERARKRNESVRKPFWWLAQTDPVARFTAYLAVFTFALVLISGWQWWEIHSGSADTRALAIAAGKQADAMTVQNAIIKDELRYIEERTRGVIKVNVVPISWKWDEGRKKFTLTYVPELKNVGNDIAKDIKVEGRIIPNETKSRVEDDEICHMLADRYKKEEPGYLGFVLYPGESYPGNGQPIGHWSTDFIESEIARSKSKIIGNPGNTFFATLIGCATYRSGISEEIKETGFIYEIVGSHPPDPIPYALREGADLAPPNLVLRVCLRMALSERCGAG
uniref:hypothetical protein n=1 Tax=Rhodoblastus sp. TaxID=1962975 RepID=UPI0026175A68